MEYDILNYSDFTRIWPIIQTKYQNNFRPLTISVKEIKDKISRRQQKYIFGVVYPHLKQGLLDAGYEVQNISDEQLDYFLRGMFYFDVVQTKKGEIKIPRRLCFGKAHKEEVSQYIDDLLRFSARIGCFIPSPVEELTSL